MRTDGIYTCDVNDYLLLLSRQDGSLTKSHQDWFYWWLNDNGIDYTKVSYVCYNELQNTIYVEELDFEHALARTWKKHKSGVGGTRIRRRGPYTVLKDYPVIEPPPAILLDRWDWLMEEIRGSERALCQTA